MAQYLLLRSLPLLCDESSSKCQIVTPITSDQVILEARDSLSYGISSLVMKYWALQAATFVLKAY